MPGTEEEKVRQLIRELHEAAQDARAAAKELNAAQRRYAGNIAQHYKKVISETDLQFIADVREYYQAITRDIQERLADLIGASSPEEVLEAILKGVRTDASDAINRAARIALKEIIVSQLPDLIRREIKDDRLRRLIAEEFHNQVQLMVGTPFGGTASPLPSMRGGGITAVQDISGRKKHAGRRR